MNFQPQGLIAHGRPRLTEMRARHFRSLRDVRLELDPLTVLVGANAAGKSNTVDAFVFVAESLRLGLLTALERRGGIRSVRHRSPKGHPRNVRLGFDLEFSQGQTVTYEFEIKSHPEGTYAVSEEVCDIKTSAGGEAARLLVKKGKLIEQPKIFVKMDDQVVDFTSTWIGTRPTLDDQLLALPVLAAHPMLAPVFEALRSIRSYAIDPAKIREPQDPDEGRFLFTDGSNSTSVFRKLSPSARESVIELLAHAVPSIIDIKIVSRGPKLTTQFVQRTQGGRMTFDAHQMSDGTLRLVGILLALYQKADTAFVAIEEPEASVHVAAAEALVELFVTQSDDVQILMTTHSADVLDFVDVSSLRLVRAGPGYSELAPIADHTREVVKSELFRPGELLRANALRGEGETDVLPQEQ